MSFSTQFKENGGFSNTTQQGLSFTKCPKPVCLFFLNMSVSCCRWWWWRWWERQGHGREHWRPPSAVSMRSQVVGVSVHQDPGCLCKMLRRDRLMDKLGRCMRTPVIKQVALKQNPAPWERNLPSDLQTAFGAPASCNPGVPVKFTIWRPMMSSEKSLSTALNNQGVEMASSIGSLRRRRRTRRRGRAPASSENLCSQDLRARRV